MMKIEVRKARVRVVMRNKQEGSVLQGTVQAACLGFETHLDVESDEPRERVAALVRQAENGCYTMQAVLHPVPIERTVTLNGAPLPAAAVSGAPPADSAAPGA
jgi:hypothetical protein